MWWLMMWAKVLWEGVKAERLLSKVSPFPSSASHPALSLLRVLWVFSDCSHQHKGRLAQFWYSCSLKANLWLYEMMSLMWHKRPCRHLPAQLQLGQQRHSKSAISTLDGGCCFLSAVGRLVAVSKFTPGNSDFFTWKKVCLLWLRLILTLREYSSFSTHLPPSSVCSTLLLWFACAQTVLCRTAAGRVSAETLFKLKFSHALSVWLYFLKHAHFCNFIF